MSFITTKFVLVSVLGLAALSASVAASGQPERSKPATKESAQPGKESAKDKVVGDPYPSATCPTSGGKLGSMGEPVIKMYDGREVRFCCDACPSKFEKDLAKSLAKLGEAIVKDQLPLYPLTTSVVSGKKLPEKPVDWVYNNRLVRLTDEAEKAEFLKDPKKHMAALDKAVVEKQAKDYPLTTCPVSKDKLGDMGEPKDVVIANRLIRLCCAACEKDVRKEPVKYIAMIDDARKGKSHGNDAGDQKPAGDGK